MKIISERIYIFSNCIRKLNLLLAITVLCVSGISAASWRLYPSFDRTPLRIMDAGDETFFLVHQQPYDKNITSGYGFPTLALFHYSNEHPEKGIEPLSHSVSLSSQDIRLADYNPVAKRLFVGYANGVIDIVAKDGSVITVDALFKSHYPGMGNINSFSFDPASGETWVATDAGYLQLDGVTGEVKNPVPSGMKLLRVFGAGDNLVWLSANRIYLAKKGSLKPEPVLIDAPGTVAAILPLDHRKFYYLSGVAGGSNGIYLAEIENGDLKTTKLGEDRFTSLTTQTSVVGRLESNLIPAESGYLLFSSTKAWHLPYSAENGLYSITLGETDQTVLGSWDMRDFWSYRDRGKFINRHAEYEFVDGKSSYTPVWEDKGEAIRPNAPASFLCSFIRYSPQYGLLAQNHGFDWIYTYYSRVNPLLLSTLQGDKWRVISPAYEMPYAVEADRALQNRYFSERNWFPMADPHGIAIDPLNPDYIWCGSNWSGIGRFDIGDIRRMPRRFGCEQDKFADLPGFQVVCGDQKWDTMSTFAPPSIDSEGTLWSMYFNYINRLTKDPQAELYYLTPEERARIAESESDEEVKWGKITLPVYETLNMANRQIALLHPSNRTKLVVFPSFYNGYLLVYDHKGTLEDTSDDEYVKLRKFRRPEGSTSTLSKIYDMTENPETGEVVVATDSRVFLFNPSDKVEDETIDVRMLGLKDGSSSDIIPESTPVARVIFDSEGRLWIGTTNQGVIGVNKDFTEVIARYNTGNSPLPSNMAYGLGWNPEERSLLISTDKGMAIVQPDVASGESGNGVPSIYPKAIAPGYQGALWFRNLTPNMRITVTDKSGKEVKRLHSGMEAEISWNLTDNEGNRLASGSYEIKFSDGTILSLPLLTAE